MTVSARGRNRPRRPRWSPCPGGTATVVASPPIAVTPEPSPADTASRTSIRPTPPPAARCRRRTGNHGVAATRNPAGAYGLRAAQRFVGAVVLPTSGRESGTEPSRFGIFTAGSVLASRTSASPMIPFRLQEVRRHRVDLVVGEEAGLVERLRAVDVAPESGGIARTCRWSGQPCHQGPRGDSR